MISRGASVHVREAKGSTPLHRACGASSYDVIKLLLERGADATAENLVGQTPYDCSNCNNRMPRPDAPRCQRSRPTLMHAFAVCSCAIAYALRV